MTEISRLPLLRWLRRIAARVSELALEANTSRIALSHHPEDESARGLR